MIKQTTKYFNLEEAPVWELAHELTLKIYDATRKFPAEEIYGLTSQIRRSASSIPANISEGFYRDTTKELIRFLYNARGSYGETLYHLRLAKDLGYVKEQEYEYLLTNYSSLGKQLNAWIKSLKKKI